MQLTKSSDAELQRQAVWALGHLVVCHNDNQCAAAAAGAIPLVMQLTKSSDAALQMRAVTTLGYLVVWHNNNQCAAGAAGAVEHMCSLLSTSPVPAVAQEALQTLNCLTHLAGDNSRRAVSLGAVALLTQLKGRKGDKFDEFIGSVLVNLAKVAGAPLPQPSKAAASPPPSPLLCPRRPPPRRPSPRLLLKPKLLPMPPSLFHSALALCATPCRKCP